MYEMKNIDKNEVANCEAVQPMTMTVKQMAKALCVSRNQAYELKDTPGFPAFRIGKRVLINRELLQEWLNRQCDAALLPE